MINPPRLYRELTAMRHVRRFSRMPCVFPINNAEHSYYVAVLATAYARQLYHHGYTLLDIGRIALGALWHDAAEAHTGDIPHDVKRYSREMQQAVRDADFSARGALQKWTDGEDYVFELRPVDKLLIKLSDCVELLGYVATEQRVGNRGLDLASKRIWNIVHGKLKSDAEDIGVSDWYTVAVKQVRDTLTESYLEGASWPPIV